MAYDEKTAGRVRAALKGRRGITERRMFGGIAFMLRGNMIAGVLNEDLVVRLGNEGAAMALKRKHVRPMDFTGKPLKSMVYVSPAGFKTAEALVAWIEAGLKYSKTLPTE